MSEYIIGQRKTLNLLKIAKEKRLHVLLSGQAGCGKTLLAKQYMAMHGAEYILMQCPEHNMFSWKIKDLTFNLMIDEIHKMDSFEVLYPVLDKREIVVCATTTDDGLLPDALRSRMLTVTPEPYSVYELAAIVEIHNNRINYDIQDAIAELSFGSPRRAIMLAELVDESIKTKDELLSFLEKIGYKNGLTSRERELLETLLDGPKSLSYLMRKLRAGKKTVELIEQNLISAGLIEITRRGRVITEDGRAVL